MFPSLFVFLVGLCLVFLWLFFSPFFLFLVCLFFFFVYCFLVLAWFFVVSVVLVSDYDKRKRCFRYSSGVLWDTVVAKPNFGPDVLLVCVGAVTSNLCSEGGKRAFLLTRSVLGNVTFVII